MSTNSVLKSVRSLNTIIDKRLGAISALGATSVSAFIAMTDVAFQNRGGIDGQRETVKTTTATRIRERMKEDIRRGTVLPALVLGVVDSGQVDRFADATAEEIAAFDWGTYLTSIAPDKISIIDGMQRTSALREVLESTPAVGEFEVRVEFWLVKGTTSLTYRMLVLNTGQTPWTLRRQMEVIFASLLAELTSRLNDAGAEHFQLYGIGDRHRRTAAGEFQANEIIEMYLAFGLRKTAIETETALADQFARLDLVEAAASDSYIRSFVSCLACLILLDKAVSRCPEIAGGAGSRSKIRAGRHIFDSLPACIGFVVAFAQLVLGRAGSAERDSDNVQRRMNTYESTVKDRVDRLNRMAPDDLIQFMDLQTLSEVLQQPSGKIGEFERSLFLEAFRLFLTEPELSSMTVCWRALS